MLFPYVVDTNECLDNTCQNGVCINHEGSFQCKCFEGYHHDSNGICVDINECEEVHYHLSYIKSGWAEETQTDTFIPPGPGFEEQN